MSPIPTKQMRLLTEMNKTIYTEFTLNLHWDIKWATNTNFKHNKLNPKNVIVGHHKINSFRNKFESLKPFIYNACDIF